MSERTITFDQIKVGDRIKARDPNPKIKEA